MSQFDFINDTATLHFCYKNSQLKVSILKNGRVSTSRVFNKENINGKSLDEIIDDFSPSFQDELELMPEKDGEELKVEAYVWDSISEIVMEFGFDEAPLMALFTTVAVDLLLGKDPLSWLKYPQLTIEYPHLKVRDGHFTLPMTGSDMIDWNVRVDFPNSFQAN